MRNRVRTGFGYLVIDHATNLVISWPNLGIQIWAQIFGAKLVRAIFLGPVATNNYFSSLTTYL